MRAALLTAVLLVLPSSAAAQDEDKSWELGTEVGASVFFGASDQTAVLFRADYTLEGEHLEFNASGGFDYGEAEDESGTSFVNKRSWSLGSELDYEAGDWAPFVFASGEGSFKRQIDLRLSGGAGTRYNFIRNDRTRFDISVAVLAERTDARVAPGEPEEVETLARWSNRLRFNQKFGGDRAEFQAVAFYRPSFQEPGTDYTVDLESSLAFSLNGTVSFKVSLVDKYDALATTRGATSNNDGRLFFSILMRH